MHHPTDAAQPSNVNSRLKLKRCLLVGVIMSACGCASAPLNQLSLPGRHVAHAQQTPKTQATPKAQAANQLVSSPKGSQRSPSAHDRAAVNPKTTTPAVIPVSHQEAVHDPSGEVVSDVHCAPGGQACPDNGTCSAGQWGHDQCGNGTCSCEPTYPPVPQYWNDQEYVYDGGDREPKVQVTNDWQVRGLDSQDTVAHYETIEGKLCVTPSNRVPIYAPRFGAVRKMTAPTIAARAVGATPLVEPLGPSIKSTHEPANNVASPVGPKNREVVKLIDGLRDRTRGVAAEKIMPAHDLSSYQMALNRLQNHTASLKREDLIAIIGEYMVNARTWVNPEGIAVAMNGINAAQLRDAKEVQDVTVYEVEPGKCSLRICKAASHSAASPGDIIHFSIRFDNIGNKPIGNLVILDSLVTRLEYIDGSQQCLLSLASNKTPEKEGNPVKFSTSENEAGSTVLRWEADLPLEAGDSGVITFRCRVR